MELRPLLDQAMKAQTFEALAQHVLSALLDRMETPTKAHSAKLHRAMVHLRPNGSYRGLAVVDAQTRKLEQPDEGDPLLSSATAWRLVERHGQPVDIDVQLALARVSDQEIELPTDNDDEDSFSSQHRLLDREATHVLALPLRSLKGRILGMASIEAGCLAGVGGPSIWGEAISDAALLLDVVGPHLSGLPPAQTALDLSDPLLPVVGQSMKSTIRAGLGLCDTT